jgi:uroporphyrinogen decarboxylase
MKPRDAVLSVLRHEEIHPIPYSLGFEGDIAERLDEHYGNKEWRDKLRTYMAESGVVDTLKFDWLKDREGYARDMFGTLWRMDQRPWHQEQVALQQPTFDGYEWPAPERFFADEKAIADARGRCRKNKEEYFIFAGLGWGLFESSWGVRGFENVLIDVIVNEDFYEELLERLTEQFLAYVDFTCRELPEIDAIMFGDDWGEQRGVTVGPDRWRKLFKPRVARIYERAHSYGKYVITHCCGSVADIMDDIVEIGLDVLESCQPEAQGMNPYELKKRWGNNLTFWGALGSQSTIPFGTPAEIREEIHNRCVNMGRGGGYILAPAKDLQPGTPVENAAAVVETFTSKEL